MVIHVPDHFSSKFAFDLAKLPSAKTDRSSLLLAVSGWICGTLLLCLGIFELFSFITAEKGSGQSFLAVEIFAFIIVLIALGIVIGSTLSIIRYKKFYFDGETFTITYRPAIGVTHRFTEPLQNYAGVRLRVLFTQSGLFNRSRYIIDLYHKDSNKIIPLYISTQNKNIRKIWEDYARRFNLPALSIGDRGLIQRDCADLDKSLKTLAAEQKLPFIASGKLPAPESLSVEEQRTSTVVEPSAIYWDIFSTLFLLIAIAAVLLLTAGGVYLTIIGTTLPLKYWAFGAILLLAVLYFSTKLFNSYRLILGRDSVSVIKTLFGTPLNEENIAADKIENVELSYNPTIDRYSLAIISDEKVITLGGRLPVNDLLWLKDFVIRKLIGN